MDLRLALHDLAHTHRLDAVAARRLESLAGFDAEPARLQRTLPLGLAVLLFTDGPSGVKKALGLAVSVPNRAARAYLSGIHGLDPERTGNVIEVELAPGVKPPDFEASERRTLATSACGVCGRASIDDLLARLVPQSDPPTFDAAWLTSLTDELRPAQQNFAVTGGLHAALITEPQRGHQVLREDIGRHNAVDKAIGRLLLDRSLPATNAALVVSGRAGFEIVQKALMAGISALVSLSAPSSLAIGTAARSGMVLLGFARGSDFNVYAGAERLRGLSGRGI